MISGKRGHVSHLEEAQAEIRGLRHSRPGDLFKEQCCEGEAEADGKLEWKTETPNIVCDWCEKS